MAKQGSIPNQVEVYAHGMPIQGHRRILGAGEPSYPADVLEFGRWLCLLWVMFAHAIPWAVLAQGNSAMPAWCEKAAQTAVSIFQPAGETHPGVLGFIVLSGYLAHRNGKRASPTLVDRTHVLSLCRLFALYVLASLFGFAAFTIAKSLNPDIAKLLSGTNVLAWHLAAAKLSGFSAFYPPLYAEAFQGNASAHLAAIVLWLCLSCLAIVKLQRRVGGERWLWFALFAVWFGGNVSITVAPKYAGWWHTGSIFNFKLLWWIGAWFVDFKSTQRSRRILVAIGATWFALTAALFWKLTVSGLVVAPKTLCLAVLIGVTAATIDRSRFSIPLWMTRVGQSALTTFVFHGPILYVLLIFGLPWWISLATAVAWGIICSVGLGAVFAALDKTNIGRSDQSTA